VVIAIQEIPADGYARNGLRFMEARVWRVGRADGGTWMKKRRKIPRREAFFNGELSRKSGKKEWRDAASRRA